MNLFQFFRKKKKTTVQELLPDRPFLEMPKLVPWKPLLTPEERRQLAEKDFQNCIENFNRARRSCYNADIELSEALLSEALSKTDDDEIANTSTLNP